MARKRYTTPEQVRENAAVSCGIRRALLCLPVAACRTSSDYSAG